jgi:hypothetical protein
MEAIRRWIRPPETDAEYIESIRQSHARERADGIRHLLMGIGAFSGFILAGCLFVWPRRMETPEFHSYTAAGAFWGIAAGALAAFFIYSLEADSARPRLVLKVCLLAVVLAIALLMGFWVPSLVEHRVEGISAKVGFREGAVGGLLPGFLLCAAFQHGIWARQKLTGERKAEELLLKYYDEQKNPPGSK